MRNPPILTAPGERGAPVYAGRILADARVDDTAYGQVLTWTLTDLDSEHGDVVVASGSASMRGPMAAADLPMNTAALAFVRRDRLRRESPLYAQLVEGGPLGRVEGVHVDTRALAGGGA
jgi:hypothetical protein